MSNAYHAIELDGKDLPGGFEAWRSGQHGRSLKRCVIVIDDSLVRYAMVPAFDEARSVREYQEGARLRCETLLGWSPEKWTVQVALPPRSGAVLCCAYRTMDAQDWRAACCKSGDNDPTIAPSAIAAVNRHRARLTEDGWVVIVSAASGVAILLREHAPAAVYQTDVSAERSWRKADVEQWVGSLALFEPTAETGVRYVIDARTWAGGSRLHKSLAHLL